MNTRTNMGAFARKLEAAAAVNNSWLMIGLDPVLSMLPAGFGRDIDSMLEFNRKIVDATKDLVAGYKPNFAFYESLGAPGWDALRQTRDMIPPNLLALGDAKRGDIGDTSEMYARAIFDELGFDAATISPYVGREGLQPFIERSDRGCFILCRTSNRDSFIQDLITEHGPAYEVVASQARDWGENVGLVVGATDLKALKRVRTLCPSTPLLVPGVGSQGGTLEDTVREAASGKPGRALISVSRSVLYASNGSDFADAARSVAISLRDSIRRLTTLALPAT